MKPDDGKTIINEGTCKTLLLSLRAKRSNLPALLNQQVTRLFRRFAPRNDSICEVLQEAPWHWLFTQRTGFAETSRHIRHRRA